MGGSSVVRGGGECEEAVVEVAALSVDPALPSPRVKAIPTTTTMAAAAPATAKSTVLFDFLGTKSASL